MYDYLEFMVTNVLLTFMITIEYTEDDGREELKIMKNRKWMKGRETGGMQGEEEDSKRKWKKEDESKETWKGRKARGSGSGRGGKHIEVKGEESILK